MKKLLIFLLFFSAYGHCFSQIQNWVDIKNFQSIRGVKIDSILTLSSDTTHNKLRKSIAYVNNNLYIADGTKWSLVAGSGGNCDSVVSQVEAFPDSSGYWGFNCNGDTILVVTYYSDGTGGGGGSGNTLSATQTFTGDGDTYDFTISTPNINNFSAPVYLDYKPGDELPPTQGANSVTLHYNLPPPDGQSFTVKIIYTIP